jgi:hypothetical protein
LMQSGCKICVKIMSFHTEYHILDNFEINEGYYPAFRRIAITFGKI